MRFIKSALATTAAAVIGGSTLLAAAPANAAGSVCDGTQVRTCINVRISGGTATPAARITDMPDGVDFQVKTTDVVLQRKSDGSWVNAKQPVPDHDGWHDTEDLALGHSLACSPGSPVTVRAKARFDWKRAGTDYEWAYSKPVTLICPS